MPTIELDDVASTLRAARAGLAPIDPPTTTWPQLDAELAFAAAKINVDHAVAAGDRIVGYKLGNIAKVMQDKFGVDQPDYGYLLGSIFEYEDTSLDLADFIEPYVELEPAFVLKKSLGGANVTIVDVMNAIDYVVPAIEIIDSRVKNWNIGLADTLADNGSTGAVLLSGTPRTLTELTLNNTVGYLDFNAKRVIAGNTRNILGNPVAALAWLVKRLSAYDIEFQPGQVVLPGSCLQAVPMNEVGTWRGVFEGFGDIQFDVVDSRRA